MANLHDKMTESEFGQVKKVWDAHQASGRIAPEKAEKEIADILLACPKVQRETVDWFAYWLVTVARELAWEDPEIMLEQDPPRKKWWRIGHGVYVRSSFIAVGH